MLPLSLTPQIWSDAFVRAGMLSPSWACKFGDDGADGYVRGEGVAAVLLRLAPAAERNGDLIYATIRGSAVNQDGKSNGLTAPNPASQEALLRTAYSPQEEGGTGVPAGSVSYIEAHGTGTRLGDPIELKALATVLCEDRGTTSKAAAQGRAPSQNLLVGSAKSTIGHLECAAGMAGLLKTCLILHHGEIPPSLHYTTPNAMVPFEKAGISVR